MLSFRVPYPPEFCREMVELVLSGRIREERPGEFEPRAQSIWNWVCQAQRDGGARRDRGASSRELEELAKLRRENHRLRRGRDILAKVAAIGRTRPPPSSAS